MTGDEERERTGAPLTSRLRGVVTRSVIDSQAVADRALGLANTLQREALDLIEQKGADMTAVEAQRVLRLFLLRRLLQGGVDVKELANVGKEASSLFPPAKVSDGELRVTV